MKKLIKVIGSLFLLSSLGFVACKQSTTPTPTETPKEDPKLSSYFTKEEIQKWNKAYETATRIFTIQGDKHESSMNSQKVVNVPGVVTSIKDGSKYKNINEFTIQDISGDGNVKTSDAIQVYLGFSDKNTLPSLEELKIGDIVTVSGTVNEYAYMAKGQTKSEDLSVTQIKVTSEDDLKITRPTQAKLPAPILINYSDLNKKVFNESSTLADSLDPANEALDYFESLESMRVCVKNPSVVAPAYKSTDYIIPGDHTLTLSENGGVVLNEYNHNDFVFLNASYSFGDREKAGLESGYSLKGGDKFIGDIIGVIGYGFSNYEIRMTEKFPTLTKSTLNEGTVKAFDPAKLNIVSYNVENFSCIQAEDNYKNKISYIGNPHRAPLFANELVNKLNKPDVICLIEIQDDTSKNDDGVVTAEKTLKLLIDEIKKLDPTLDYAAVNVDPVNNGNGGAPGANIRCCYLYRTDRIELVPDTTPDLPSDSTCEATFENGKLVQNPARLGTKLMAEGQAFNGTRNTLVAHFKFKEGINGGKDFIVLNNHLKSKRGDTKVYGSTQPVVRSSDPIRLKQAEVVSNFIKTTGDTPVISVGDYNDFWFSDVAKKIKTENNMTNVIETLPMNERYTYTFSGNSQTLDQILVKGFTGIEGGVLHVNSIKPKHTPTKGETVWPSDKQLSDHDPVWAQLAF